MKKILLICNESKTVINFRKELIVFLNNHGYEIGVIVGDDEFISDIKKLGVETFLVPFENRSINPFKTFGLVRKFKKIIETFNPEIIFTFQIKPNIFGSKAAAKASQVPVFNMVEGLGDPFQPKSFVERIIRLFVIKLYKKSFRLSKAVFFLNKSDKKEFIDRKIVDEQKCVLIPGIGIDVSSFTPSFDFPKKHKVLYIGRLIKNKGIFEFCEIARLVRKTRNDIDFEIYGSESQVTTTDLRSYFNDNSVSYCGYSTDIKDIIKKSSILLSTSYREGFPRTILEAMALGRPTIASNVIGNRDIVVDGVTGYLIDKDNLNSFAEKIIELVDNREMMIKLGKQARKLCEEQYNSDKINEMILKVISQ